MYTIENIKFIKGKAIIKDGRKILAKIYDRKEFHKGTKLENNSFSSPFQLVLKNICSGVARDCNDLEECVFFLNKYL